MVPHCKVKNSNNNNNKLKKRIIKKKKIKKKKSSQIVDLFPISYHLERRIISFVQLMSQKPIFFPLWKKKKNLSLAQIYIFTYAYTNMYVCSVASVTSALCNPMDCSPPGCSVHEILQTRILEWVAMASSQGFFQLRGWTHVSYVSCIADGFFTIGEALCTYIHTHTHTHTHIHIDR